MRTFDERQHIDELQEICSHCMEPMEFCLCDTWVQQKDEKQHEEGGALDDDVLF